MKILTSKIIYASQAQESHNQTSEKQKKTNKFFSNIFSVRNTSLSLKEKFKLSAPLQLSYLYPKN